MVYTLDDAASVLGLSRPTLLFWEEALRTELNVTRDHEGKLQFEDHHVRAIAEVRRWVVDEKLSLQEARQRLAGALAASMHPLEGAAGDLQQRQPPEQERGPSGDGPRDPSVKQRHAADVAPQAGEPRDALGDRVAELIETVGYLVDENRALQELIGRLIQFVEELGQRDAASPAASSNSLSDGDTDAARDEPAVPAPGPTASCDLSGTPEPSDRSHGVGAGIAPQANASVNRLAGHRPLSLAERRAAIAAQREAQLARLKARSASSPASTRDLDPCSRTVGLN